MRYAIVINIDYISNPEDTCKRLWSQIRQGMMENGFRLEGRIFTTNMHAEEACDTARGVIDGIDLQALGIDDIYIYLKEFFGYDNSETVNLLLPPTSDFLIDDQ
jgi:hypothetical protein